MTDRRSSQDLFESTPFNTQSTTCYCQSQPGWGSMKIYGPSREAHFLITKFIQLRPWVPLVSDPTNLHKPLLQKLTYIPPVFTLTYSFFNQIERYFLINTLVLRVFPKHTHKCPGMVTSLVALILYCSGHIFGIYICISDQKKPLFSVVVGFHWWYLENLYPLWNQ